MKLIYAWGHVQGYSGKRKVEPCDLFKVNIYQAPLLFSSPSFLAILLDCFMTLAFSISLYPKMSPSHFVTVPFSQIQI